MLVVDWLVAVFVAVTVAPGKTAFEVSVTRPLIAPRNSCAEPGAAMSAARHTTPHTRATNPRVQIIAPSNLYVEAGLLDPPDRAGLKSRPYVQCPASQIRTKAARRAESSACLWPNESYRKWPAH